jgi:cytochrome c oxidase subunit 2
LPRGAPVRLRFRLAAALAPTRKDVYRMIAIGVVIAAVATWGSIQIDWFPAEGATQAHKIDTLYDWLLVASVPMFVLVMAVAIYCVVRFRVRPGQEELDGAPIHGHTRLEIVWVTIPFIIVTTLAVYAAVVLADIEKKQPNELRVRVTAQQFTWHFDYPGPGGRKVSSNVLYLPEGRPVKFDINSEDVLHSFWVPAFRLKIDAVPGQTTSIRVTPNRLGKYEVVCAELCGWGHSTMRVRTQVMPEQQFNDWLQQKAAPPKEAAGGAGASREQLAAQGKMLFTGDGGCGACHKLADAGTSGTVGPDLDEVVAAAKKFGKGQSPDEYIRESIVKPDAFVVPGFPKGTMPGDFETRLGKDKIDALVQYLLKAGGG